MQTTLLGLAIAIILALIAALVGPLLIDWGSHRALFETEATRLIGVNVRVNGAIDVRLLPSPRLALHDIVIGGGNDAVRARSLGVELQLGPLMRGEWRAAELHLSGPQVSLGLDASGHVRGPSLPVSFKPEELSIDRLSIEDGTIALNDAATGASITLGSVSFNGDARSLAGPIKGEGSLTVAGHLYPYRISVGRLSDENGARMRVNIAPGDPAFTIEADGMLAFPGADPHFDGTVTLTRPVGIGTSGTAAAQGLTEPWRLSGKVKATGQSALVQNLEFQFGSDEQGFRLSGVADVTFGKHPRLNSVLSGRQIDIDRAVTKADGTRDSPAAVVRKLADLGAAALRSPLPVQIGLGIDQLTLGGGSIQNLRGDISSEAQGWTIDRLEFRAPGLTQVRLSGRLAAAGSSIGFSGPAEIDVSDPKTLAGWLEGRAESAQNDLRPLNLRGTVTLSSEAIAVDGLQVQFDRKPASGRLAYRFASGGKSARLDADLKAAQLDFDAAFDLGRAVLGGSAMARPNEMVLSADIGHATIAGFDARDVSARVKADGAGLQIDRLSVADYGGGSFAANGRIQTDGHSPRGALSIDIDAQKTGAISAFVEKFAPQFAAPAEKILRQVGRAKLHATLDVTDADKGPATVAQATIAGDLAGLRIDARTRVTGDWQKSSLADLQFDGTLAAPESGRLLALLNLAGVAQTGKGPGRLQLRLAGPAKGDMALSAQLAADGLQAQASGQARLSGDKGPVFSGTLQIQDADLRPLRPARAASLPLKMTSRVAMMGGVTRIDDIDAKLGASGIRGRLSIGNSSPRRIDGTIEADGADAAAFVAFAVGLPSQAAAPGSAWNWSGEPFGTGVFGELTGQVALKLKNAELLPHLTASDLNASLRFSKDEIGLVDATGHLAGGQLSGQMILHTAEDGLTTQTKINVTGAKAPQLLAALARAPVSGSADFSAEAEGTGLSAVALIGSLKGEGKFVLTDTQIAGLDAHVFDAVTQATDHGVPIERGRISDLVNRSLENGPLSLKRADAGFRVAAGQIRIDTVTVDSKDAAVTAAGTLDLTDGSLDARIVLTGRSEAAGARPDISVVLKGPLSAPSRDLDVSALVSWLTLRAVENQATRLHAIETPPRTVPTSRSKQAPALPAPIDIRPAPAPRNAGRPAASVGPQR